MPFDKDTPKQFSVRLLANLHKNMADNVLEADTNSPQSQNTASLYPQSVLSLKTKNHISFNN